MDFDTWLAEQTDEVKGLVAGHIDGLKSALDSERSTRKSLEKDLRTAVSQAEAGSEMQKRLQEMERSLSSTTTKADFFQAAHQAGAKNLSLAFLAAQEAGLVGESGAVDFDKLKTGFPELFAEKVRVPGNAGEGMGNPPPAGKTSMDDLIRQQAGVSTT